MSLRVLITFYVLVHVVLVLYLWLIPSAPSKSPQRSLERLPSANLSENRMMTQVSRKSCSQVSNRFCHVIVVMTWMASHLHNVRRRPLASLGSRFPVRV